MRNKTANAVAVVYDIIMTALLTYSVTIILQTLGEGLEITYTDNDNIYLTYNKEYFNSDIGELFQCQNYYKEGKYCVSIKLEKPVDYNKPSRQIVENTPSGSIVIGYRTQFQISVVNNLKISTEVYSGSFDQAVVFDRKEHYCAPQNVSILNCGSSYVLRSKYDRSKVISLVVDYNLNTKDTKCKCIKETYDWITVKFKNSDTSKPHLYTDNGADNDQNNTFMLHPETLHGGVYIIKVNVNCMLNEASKRNSHDIPTRFSHNLAYCYIELPLKALEAVISGGSKRIVHFDKDIVLDASPSLVRNQHVLGSKSVQLTFTWSCDKIIAQFCKPITFTTDSGYKVQGPLLPKIDYEFKLVLGAPNFNPGIAYQIIRYEPKEESNIGLEVV